MFNRTTFRLIRELKGLTQAELARKSGVTQGHISQIESGWIADPTETTLRKLAAALDVPLHVICATEAAA